MACNGLLMVNYVLVQPWDLRHSLRNKWMFAVAMLHMAPADGWRQLLG